MIPNCSLYIPVPKDSYRLRENMVAVVENHGKEYKPDKYVIVGDYLYLCADFISSPQTMPKTEQYLTLVCLLLSVIFLLFLLLTYSLFAELRTLPGCNLMVLAATMITSQVTYLAGVARVDDQTKCTAVAIVLHFSLLSSFCWMAAITSDAGRTFLRKGG